MDKAADIQAILAHRYDQGWDYWTTEDRRLGKGAPFPPVKRSRQRLF